MTGPNPTTEGQTGHSAGKICIRCGRDCAARPRMRDQQGRYHCQECIDRARSQRAAHTGPQAPPAPPEPAAPAPEPDVIELEEATAPPSPAALEARSRPCPICGKPLAREAAICVECGYNAQTGERLAPAGKKKKGALPGRPPPTCAACGYSLVGILSGRCPECGRINSPGDWKRQDEEARRKRDHRWEYYKPLIMFAVGVGLTFLALLLQDKPEEIVVYMIKYAIDLVVGMVVFWVCCATFVGFDAPQHLTALRLAGIYAIINFVSMLTAVFYFIPFYGILLAWGIPFLIYTSMLAHWLEMDWSDASIVGVATYVVKLILAFFVLVYFF